MFLGRGLKGRLENLNWFLYGIAAVIRFKS